MNQEVDPHMLENMYPINNKHLITPKKNHYKIMIKMWKPDHQNMEYTKLIKDMKFLYLKTYNKSNPNTKKMMMIKNKEITSVLENNEFIN